MLLLAAIGGGVIWIATPFGVGVGYDSYFYLTAAENLAQGAGLGRFNPAGLWEPLTHFPPLYAASLAGISSMLRIEVAESARILNVLAFVGSTLAIGLWMWNVNRHSPWLLLAAGFFLASPDLFERHLWAMSEPLFFFLVLTSMAFLWHGLVSGKRWPFLLGGALAGLAPLARYAGVAVVGAGLGTVLLGRVPDWKRIRSDLVTYATGGVGVPLVWTISRLLAEPGLTNRLLAFHPLTLEKLKEAARTLGGWIPFNGLAMELRLGIVVIVVLLLAWRFLTRELTRRNPPAREPASIAALMLWLFLASYGLVLTTSLTFFDASTRLNDRILSPALMALILVGFFEMSRTVARERIGFRQALIPLALLTPLALTCVSASGALFFKSRGSGLGFQSASWRNSETLRAVRALPYESQIYSNEAIPLSFFLGSPVYAVPEMIDPVLAQQRPGFEKQLLEMRQQLRRGESFLVLFHPRELRVEMPPLEVLTEGLEVRGSYRDGMIYAAPEGSGCLPGPELVYHVEDY